MGFINRIEGRWWVGEPRSLCIVAPSLGGLPAAGGLCGCAGDRFGASLLQSYGRD